MFSKLNSFRRCLLLFAVACCIAIGIFVGVIQKAHATLTPGFGASGDWGCSGGGTIGTTPPVVTTPVVNPPTVTPPITIQLIPDGSPTPGFGITG